MPRGKPAAGPYLCLESGRNRHGESTWNQFDVTRLDFDRTFKSGMKVHARRMFGLVVREGRKRRKTLKAELYGFHSGHCSWASSHNWRFLGRENT